MSSWCGTLDFSLGDHWPKEIEVHKMFFKNGIFFFKEQNIEIESCLIFVDWLQYILENADWVAKQVNFLWNKLKKVL